MSSSRIIKTKGGQTIRLPSSVAFPRDVQAVDILKVGCGRVLVPKGMRWQGPFEGSARASEDFFPPTQPEDVYGSLRSDGKPKTIREMDSGVLAEAARRHKRGSL
jgi:antitoxin VapB